MVKKYSLNNAKSIENKNVITRSLDIVNKYAGELSIDVLPLDKIELDPENNRILALTLKDAINGINPLDKNLEQKKKDLKSLESLANTIKENQLINPILVYRFGNKCRLIAGERRTLASAIAGKKEIIARIAAERPQGKKLRVLQWIENNERVDLSLAERIANIEAIANEFFLESSQSQNLKNLTAKMLSDLTQMSITQSRRYLIMLQAKPDIKQAILEGKLENIKLIELICLTSDESYQTQLLNAALAGETVPNMIKLKKNLESNSLPRKIRPRNRGLVSIGKIKTDIAKIIIDSLKSSNLIAPHIVNEIDGLTKDVEWQDNFSVEDIFKKIILILKGVAA